MKAPKSIVLTTPAAIQAERDRIQASFAALELQVKALETHTNIITMTDEFLAKVGEVAGKPMTIADLAAMRSVKATRSRAARTPSDKTKRLTDDEIADLTQRLNVRAAQLAAGRPPEQITVIAEAFGVSPQTVQTYEKKRKAAEEAKALFEKGQQSAAPAATENQAAR